MPSLPGKVRLALAALTLFWASVPSARAQLTQQTLIYQGTLRTWYVHVPASYNGSKAVPLVLVLHGVGDNATGFAVASEWMPTSDRVGCIAVFPNGGLVYGDTSFGWNNWVFDGSAPDDVGFLLALINQLKSTYNVDAGRVYMTGLSNGGGMSNEFVGVAHASELAAIAAVSCGWMTAYGVAESNMKPDAPLPVWIFRGELENGTTGGFTLTEQDQQQTAFWVNFNGDNPVPQVSTKGIYTQSVYTGGRAEVRYTTVAGHAHQYGPGFADKIWDEFFSTTTRMTGAVVTPTPTPATVTVTADGPRASLADGVPGSFLLRRQGGGADPLTVNYAMSGRAVGGQDYKLLKGKRAFPAGTDAVHVQVRPLGVPFSGKRGVKLTLLPGDGYVTGAEASAKVKIVGGN